MKPRHIVGVVMILAPVFAGFVFLGIHLGREYGTWVPLSIAGVILWILIAVNLLDFD